MTNIMILGLRGSGKDTVANALNAGHDYRMFALADRIRRVCESLGLEPTKTNLIRIGEKMKEMYGQTIWIDLLNKDIAYSDERFEKYLEQYQTGEESCKVITDVRRTYEYSHYLEKGYLPVKIEANFDTCVSRVVERDGNIDMDAFGHSTETEQANLKGLIITNNGTLVDLYARVDQLITNLQKKGYYESHMDYFKHELTRG